MAALVASLLREQRAAEDRAMFDAWQNGGQYKGKNVTDDRLLAYIRQRRDGFSRDDPLWDEWDNRHTQYDFSIGEQKVGLAFKQGRVGAGAVAAFYRDKLKGIPKDSAFYREVAGRATQWARSAAGAARSRARGRATAPLRAKLNAQLEQQQDYLGLEAALTAHAKREGLIHGNQELADAGAAGLMDMFSRGIYADGVQITFDDFRAAAEGHHQALTAEIKTRLELGQQAPRDKRDRFVEGTLVRLNVVDERAQYEMARDAWLDSTEAARGNPYAIADANAVYQRALQGIHANAARQTDPNAIDPDFMGGLTNEFDAIATGEASGPTVAEMYGESGDAESTAKGTARLNEDMDALASNKAYFGQDEPGGDLSVIHWPQGQGPGALGLDDSLQPSVTRINGKRQIVWLKGEAITATTLVDANGRALPPEAMPTTAAELRRGLATGELDYATGENVGYRFTNPANNSVKYGVIDPTSGNMLFTDSNPWATDGENPLITGLGGGLTIFTQDTRRVGNREIPDVTALLAGRVSIDTMDPVLADSMVAPKDILALMEQGFVTGLSEADLATYQARLQRREQERLTTLGDKNTGGPRRLTQTRAPGGGGDLRSSVLSGMNSVRDVTQHVFGSSPTRTKDDIYVPPPPRAPVPDATPTPSRGDIPGVTNLPAPSRTKDDLFTPPTTTTATSPSRTKDDIYVAPTISSDPIAKIGSGGFVPR